jgi:hypothetical protein
MIRKSLATIAVALLGTLAGPVAGQRKVDHPTLRAALHEMREARNHLRDAKDVWPPGQKRQAEAALDSAIQSVKTILAVRDVDTFRGVDRNPEYYTRYKDHPRLRAALADIRDARAELRTAVVDVGGQKEQAQDDLDLAAGSIVTLIRGGKR